MYKDIFLNRKAVCFDLDGTIVDTHELWVRAHRIVLKNMGMDAGISVEDFFFPGVGLLETWSNFIKNHPEAEDIKPEELETATNQAFLAILENENIEVKNGFWSILAKSKEDHQLKIALVSNTTKDVGNKIIERIDLDESLDFKIFGDEVSKRKPNPEIYNQVLKNFKIKPSEMLVFEDSVTGAEAASKAKLDLIIMLNGESDKSEYPGNILLFIPDFETLANEVDLTYKQFWDGLIKIYTGLFEKRQENQN